MWTADVERRGVQHTLNDSDDIKRGTTRTQHGDKYKVKHTASKRADETIMDRLRTGDSLEITPYANMPIWRSGNNDQRGHEKRTLDFAIRSDERWDRI